MKIIFTFLIACIATSSIHADVWAKITDSHRLNGCTYYDVEIWSDNGTTDPGDDGVVGHGTITNCDEMDPGGGTSAVITNTYVSGPCTIWEVSIVNEAQQEIASGAIGDGDC